MSSVCFYFEVHQPFRIKPYRVLEIGRDHDYFDEELNGDIVRKVARKCYLPTNNLLLDLVRRYDGEFRISFSLTGVAIEQFKLHAPEVLDSFKELAKYDAVEFLAETYYHSLASQHDEAELWAQVEMHKRLMQQEFGRTPTVFRNTELIYEDRIGRLAEEMGFKAVIAEGADDALGWRSPNFLYSVPDTANTKLLLKNYRLSDDVAFRFSNRAWPEFPLLADKFASWVHDVSGAGDVVNLFMDYETFGEHQWEDTGIFDFMEQLPEQILKHGDWGFATPSEVVEKYPSLADLSFPRVVSWADEERDLTAWEGNTMQRRALHQIFRLGKAVRERNNPALLELWRKLQTSDHFYYMCTKWFADGDVHAYFSPYESPYEAFMNYMNVLRDFEEHVLAPRSQLAAAS